MWEEIDMHEEENGRKKRRLLILILIIAGALFAAYIVLCQIVVQNDAIWGNTTVNGVALKGLTYEEAREAVLQKYDEDYADAAITIRLDGNEYKIPVYQLLEIDVTDEIDKAYELGHGSWFASGAEWIGMQLSGGATENVEVEPTLKEDADIAKAIADSGILEYKSLVDTTWDVTETSLIIHKGVSGQTANQEQLTALVTEALNNLNFSEPIDCPYNTETPAAPDFQAIADSIYKEPANATLDPANGYAIVPGVLGTALDPQAAASAYEAAAEGTDVEVPLTVTEPDITSADMEANLFADRLGTYQSTVTGTNDKRTNIRLASEAVNGVILMPGEEFSYNGHVGNTTEDKGYKTAAVYKNGKVEYETGGGVCQVSSTIFAAILYTDLEVTQRQCHSMVVTYVPYGMDATVYWDQPDFRFVNNHAYPVRLDVSFDGSDIYVEIWGTQESDLTVEPRVEQTGTLTFTTYRDYYDAGGNLVDSEYIGGSKYKPVS
ncbi:MAG TPA: VanW family protein [Candidatus Alectryocaccobium stercorigallinarum]|nr:VanW family protein [Candidatus Alectryocaccobium stercorigallinarum]